MSNYFVHNLETDKLELHFDYSAYKALSKAQQGRIKAYCLFSKQAEAWVSKGKVKTGGAGMAKGVANELGLTDAGTTGEALDFGEQQQQRVERAERLKSLDLNGRAVSRLHQADKDFTARDNSIDARYPSPWVTGSSGYPAHRLRKRNEQHESNIRTYIAKQKLYEQRASVNHAQLLQRLKDPEYLNNRLEDAMAEFRSAERDKNETRLDEADAKIQYYQGLIDEMGGFTYSRESLTESGATHVRYRRNWYPIVRLNVKTVTFGGWLGGNVHSTWQAPYAEILDTRVESATSLLKKPGESTLGEPKPKSPFKKGDTVLYKSPFHNGIAVKVIVSVGPKNIRFGTSTSSFARVYDVFPRDYQTQERLSTYQAALSRYVASDPLKFGRILSDPSGNSFEFSRMKALGPYSYGQGYDKGNEALLENDLQVGGYANVADFYQKAILNEAPPDQTTPARAKLKLLALKLKLLIL